MPGVLEQVRGISPGRSLLRGHQVQEIKKGTIRTETITNENLGIFFLVRFRNGKANEFPLIFFRICFHNEHVGHAQPQQQATTTKKTKIIPEIFFAFAFVIEQRETIRNPGLSSFLTCNYFCEDGKLDSF